MNRLLLSLICVFAFFGSNAFAKGAEQISFSGKVDLAKQVVEKVSKAGSKNGTLFVYIKKLGNEAGPPAAVIKIANPKYPQNFQILPSNTMIPASSIAPFEGKYVIYARHSLSGEPMKKEGYIGKFTNGEKGIEAGQEFPTLMIDADYREKK